MRKRHIGCGIFLAILLLSFIFSGTVSEAETVKEDIAIKVKIDDTDTENGKKGINHNISKIDITWQNVLYILSSEENLNEITIRAKNSSGQEEESYKFDITGNISTITLKPKTYSAFEGVQKTYELKKHTLYTIHIPEGTLKRWDRPGVNNDIYFDFVTGGDDNNDILLSSSPLNLQEGIDTSDSIVFEFIDDIALNPFIISNPDEYKSYFIDIISESLIEGLSNYQSDSTDNFVVSTEGNKLILKKNNGGKLKDLSKYIVKLKDTTVFLKNTLSEVSIYNKSGSSNPWRQVEFKTNKTVEETSPENNEKYVDLEPDIRIKFKYPLKSIDSAAVLNNIKLFMGDVGGEEIDLNLNNTKIYADYDRTTLIIELNGEYGAKRLLRANTPYYFLIEKGAVGFTNYDNIVNEKIIFKFTTTAEAEGPEAKTYSSSSDLNDDITKLDSTNLDGDGNIYIGFDKAIEFDKALDWDLDDNKYSNMGAINKYFQLYDTMTTVTEHVYEQQYHNEIHIYNYEMKDTNGDDILEWCVFPEGTTKVEELEDITKIKKLSIKSIEILDHENEPKILKITPKTPLVNLNRYRIRIDKEAVEDTSGYNVDKDIEFNFFTKKSSENLEASWESVEGYSISDIEKDKPYFEMPKYGDDLPPDDDSDIVEKIGKKPIVIDVKGEIIPKVGEKLLESLKIIDVRDHYYRGETEDGEIITRIVSINKLATEYYLKDGVKYTKLYIYPSKLKYGQRYRLEIPENTFESRSGALLPELEFDFVVRSKNGEEIGILTMENNENSIIDIHKESWEIILRGYNFNEDISKVEILDTTSLKILEITTSDIEFKDVTTIVVKIRDDKKEEFIKEFGLLTDELKLKLTVYFKNGQTPGIEGLLVEPKDKPSVIDKEPSGENVQYDENGINRKKIDEEYIYFLKVTFDDIDIDKDGIGELELKFTESSDGSIDYLGLSKLMEESSINAIGSSVSMLDKDFIKKIIDIMADEEKTQDEKNEYLKYIFEKDPSKDEAYLYVPIKLLSPQTTYDVTIASNVIVYADTKQGNDIIKWSFSTMSNPVITDISRGSVVENYDEDEPIIITGEFFYDTVEVYFNNTKAEDVKRKEDEDGGVYLEVYLPDGNDRLEPGIYNIYIVNDDNHKRELYGVFSVVKEGEWVPNEEYRLQEVKQGEIRADIKVSENTAVIKSKYADNKYLELDLDELMGSNTLVRRIVIEGDEDEEIGILKTSSRWADIDLYNVKLTSDSDDEITLTLGRADQALKQFLNKKLGGKSIKSEFIRASIEEGTVTKVILSIPFDKSKGKGLRVLRYDEDTRNFYLERISVNLVDRKVTVESKHTGIFVVVED